MSNFTATVAAFRERLETNFTALPIRWPNDDRDADLKACPNGFVYCETYLTDEGPASVGADGDRRHRDEGRTNVFIYVPKGKKSGTAESYAETIRALFGVNSLSDVHISRRYIGQGESLDGPKGKYFCVPVFIDFWTDRIE